MSEQNGQMTDDAKAKAEQEQVQKSLYRNRILESLHKFNRGVATLQEKLHFDVLVPATLYAWKYKDANLIADVLNGIAAGSVRTIRVESVQFWLSEIAGFSIALDSKSQKYSARGNFQGKSTYLKDHIFNYDKAHADVIRDMKLTYWNIAPVKLSIVKVIEDKDAFFDRIEKQLALAVLAGQFDLEALQVDIGNMLNRVKSDMASDAIKKKAAKYLAESGKEDQSFG